MPQVAVLGTGRVGQAIAGRAAEVGYDVTVGARSADSESLRVFADRERIATGSFADAVAAAPLMVNATNGNVSLEALAMVGPDALHGKVLLDLANELKPPRMAGSRNRSRPPPTRWAAGSSSRTPSCGSSSP